MSDDNRTDNNNDNKDPIYVGGAIKKKVRPSPETSATLYKVDTKKTGNDGNIWKVVENTNGVKRWKLDRKKTSKSGTKEKKTKSKDTKKGNKKKISALDFYDVIHVDETEFKNICKKSNQLVQDTIDHVIKLIVDLRKLGKIAHLIPLPISSNGIYWSDYAGDYLDDVYGQEWYSNSKGYMYFTVYMNQQGTEINEKNPIGVSFSNLNREEKIQIIKLMDLYLPGRYVWTGRNTDKIFIQYIKTKIPKIDISSLKDDDLYPMLVINVRYPDTVDLIRKSVNQIPDLSDTFQKLLDLDKNETAVYYNYGIHDAEIEFNAIPLNIYNKKISNIVRYLDNEIKTNAMKSYNIRMMTDPETVQETFVSKTSKK